MKHKLDLVRAEEKRLREQVRELNKKLEIEKVNNVSLQEYVVEYKTKLEKLYDEL